MRARWRLAAALVLFVIWPAAGGELRLANGSRLAGELVNEVLLVSTGAGLVEIVPTEVVALTPDEIRLRDGRIVRGTLVGGRLRARTALGELSLRVDELESYRSTPVAPAAAPPPAEPAAAALGPAEARPPGPASPSPGHGGAGLPTVASYQDIPAAQPAAGGGSAREGGARRLEVVADETTLYGDAVRAGRSVGVVRRGERVVFVDAIDRRLLILNQLVFDGGHWVKVRLVDGTEGWVPASAVRDVAR
jgi:hypothetical protein